MTTINMPCLKTQDEPNHKLPSKVIKDVSDEQMTSSVLSTTSSLTSPVDSGVQFLDSESEIASVMSVSGMGYDENISQDNGHDCNIKDVKSLNLILYDEVEPKTKQYDILEDYVGQNVACDEPNMHITSSDLLVNETISNELKPLRCDKVERKDNFSFNFDVDINNAQNYSFEATACDPYQNSSVFDAENQLKQMLQSHENSVTAEENKLKSNEEQIVFRRQRKKKSKSSTPKKRVSFHEDILNSTKIDDIHINHGFITHELNECRSFFGKNFCFKPEDAGRYSWAAGGDACYYESCMPERQVKSDMYIHNGRFSSSCTSSSNSISSSVDADDEHFSSEETFVRNVPSQKLPKSSCLKKPKRKGYINTNIVQEKINAHTKKNDTTLLDINLFGSIKNILNFSTSVPLAECEVFTGQENVLSSSCDFKKENKVTINALREKFKKQAPPNKLKKIENLKPTKFDELPAGNVQSNIILCDNNIYEHKGLSYSYEYDFCEQKKKQESRSLYQKVFKDLSFSFFNKKSKNKPEETNPNTKVVELEIDNIKSFASNSSTARMSWGESVSNLSECGGSARHLDSPKKKIKKANHYSVQSFKTDDSESHSQTSLKFLECLKPSSPKATLLNRFLRNVTFKKMLDVKVVGKKNANHCLKLYVDGIKFDSSVNNAINKQIEDEIINERIRRKPFEKNARSSLRIKFKTEISNSKNEVFVQAFPVYSTYTMAGTSRSLLLILSDIAFYVVELIPEASYCKRFVLSYTELNTVLVGPNSQTIHYSSHNYDRQYMIITGCSNVTNSIMAQMEMAIRKDRNKPKLPAVKQLDMRDMNHLLKSVCNQTVIQKDEEYYYYAVVHFQDLNSELPDATLGPNKEGPLMFKLEYESRWETAYFILKLGVLYMLSSPSYRVPLRVFSLVNGSCQGAKRVFHSPRPHTFQLVIEGKILLLAAPDEYVASEWLQSLVHAASGTYSYHEKNASQSCSLLMTCDHILMVRERFPSASEPLGSEKTSQSVLKGTQVLSCAAISDIMALRLPSAEQSWCILEFTCREVLESSGDWILYFSTNSELENFIATLEMLWAYHNENGDSFPLSTIPETEVLSRRCVESYKVLQNAWAHIPLNLQSY